MDIFTPIWDRIAAHAGSEFRQKTGRPFTFSLVGNAIVPSTTNRMLTRSQFQQAHLRSPLHGPGQLQDLQGPSYLFAILTDPRVATGSSEVPPSTPIRANSRPVTLLESPWRPGRASNPSSLALHADQRTGTVVGANELATMGFRPLELHISKQEVQVGDAVGCEWITIGDVPEVPRARLGQVEDPG